MFSRLFIFPLRELDSLIASAMHWKIEFFPIPRVSPNHESATGESAANTVFPVCELYCLKSFRISFGENGRDEAVLYRISVFIYWREVESRYETGNASMVALADVCQAIKLFLEIAMW